MFLSYFLILSIVLGVAVIDGLIALDASDPTIFVSGFLLGGFCVIVLTACCISKAGKPRSNFSGRVSFSLT